MKTTRINLRATDFARPPAYHVDMWQELLDALHLASSTTGEVVVDISLVKVYPPEEDDSALEGK